MSVVIETTIGDLTVDLFTEERPIACLNFIKLCKLKYYNFNLFHTIEQGFIAQSGDPSGAGDGGSSIWGVVEGQHKRFFEAESLPKIYHTSSGLLSLVGAGKHLVGSQFFFTLGENLTSLDGQHCVIGEVVEGHEVLRKLNESIVDEKFRPYQDIRITHTVILDDPFEDTRGFREPSRSPSPSADRLKNGRIAADEDIDDTDGKSMEEIQEMLAEREAKARATILEIVGDLPDAEMAPPENVLFVCKLNPVTTDDDLEIIFSRFGRVKSCEVIRDRKTGDSLQYAFVEFEEQKSCEAAYFKMDNVLIDDRRIHVDFSQSVSKLKWRGKGRGVEGDSKTIDFNNLRERGGDNRRIERRRQDVNRDNSPRRNNRRDDYHRDSRERMNSAERRKAREERHKQQEKQRNQSRSRSPIRRDRRNSRDRDHSYKNIEDRHKHQKKQRNQSRSRSPIRRERRNSRDRDHSYKNSRRDYDKQSPNRNRKDRFSSPVRKREQRRHSSERRQDLKREQSYNTEKQDQSRNRENNYATERKYDNKKPIRNISPETKVKGKPKTSAKRKKDKKKRKSKKSRKDSSSSEDSSSEDDSSSSEESMSSSTDSSTSEEEKRKKSKSKSKKKSSKKSKKYRK